MTPLGNPKPSGTNEGPLPNSSPLIAADFKFDGKIHLLLAASGSVATIKIPNILAALADHQNLAIRLLLTKSAQNFLNGQSHEQPALKSFLPSVNNNSPFKNLEAIYVDEDEWSTPWKRGGGVLHIELRRWADMLVVAPLSANTLAKMTGGLSDNLLTSVIRAWDTTGVIDPFTNHPINPSNEGSVSRKRIIVAVAMNTAMWHHPITSRQIKILEQDWGVNNSDGDGWIEVLRPVEKELACGDVGDGAMKEWTAIVSIIRMRLGLTQNEYNLT